MLRRRKSVTRLVFRYTACDSDQRIKVLLLFLIALFGIAFVVHFLLSSSRRPKCNCFFPNTGEYGVFKEWRMRGQRLRETARVKRVIHTTVASPEKSAT